ncbi:hypothetical protein [Aeromicrobium sp.]|uniref:hypothetical protein n=1 Tax=Aeromicrobium sp. TaxID=1871063 RepID=UPI003D6BEC9A
MTISDPTPMTYEQWGVAFFQHAISEGRILGPISVLAGEPIEFGPMRVGPGRVASVSASGRVGQPVAERRGDDPVRYLVRLPVDVDFSLDLQVSTHHFSAVLDIPLVLTAVAAPPLTVFIHVETPAPKEIDIDLHADGLGASVVKEVADVKGELRRFVAKYVAREVEKPHILEARTIDVLTLIDGALSGR